MRIIFFGTPEPATIVLEKLIKGKHEIVCVVTQPDRPKGRGQKLAFSPVKELALKHTIPVEQPEGVRGNKVFQSLLASLKADIAVVVAYGKILPREILETPKHGFINLHASLLPKYRGAAPVQWAILKGEKESGITIFKIVEQLDAGPIIAQKKVRIFEDDTAETLLKNIMTEGAKLLPAVLKEVAAGKIQYLKQDEAEVTYAPQLTKESGEIDWKKSAREIHDRIRGLIPWPAAHTFCRGKRLKITKSELHLPDIQSGQKEAGAIVEIVKPDGFIVATGAGNLLVLEVQPESGKRMKAYDFALGHDVKIAEILPN
ncbi:MAG: methionyl-tRNA formyltransferase [Candidatus Margulisbacteria bacterium]|nr:methionyl-tRNA formyltransferase [Candidatus Margulisiibacteriota bacterium]